MKNSYPKFLGIYHDPNSRKWELFNLIEIHKSPSDQKNYVVDRVIREHGHTPLRTPPYMCEFNPIEMVWSQLKHFIRSHNTTGEFSIKVLKELTEQAIASATPEDWQNYCRHVINIENSFWEKDQIMEEVEPLIISVNDEDSDSDSNISNYSDSDNSSDKEN